MPDQSLLDISSANKLSEAAALALGRDVKLVLHPETSPQTLRAITDTMYQKAYFF